MDLVELLEAIRQQYIDQLALALHEAKNEPTGRLISEAVLRNDQGEPLREGRLNLPVRIDGIVVQADGQGFESLSVESTQVVAGFADIQFDWPGGLAVILNPFAWDALKIYLPEGHPGMDWEPLLSWYEEWFRVEEDGTGDLLLVVHGLSDPREHDTGVVLLIDMGSAPINALEDLLDALAGLDVSRAEIGSRPPGE